MDQDNNQFNQNNLNNGTPNNQPLQNNSNLNNAYPMQSTENSNVYQQPNYNQPTNQNINNQELNGVNLQSTNEQMTQSVNTSNEIPSNTSFNPSINNQYSNNIGPNNFGDSYSSPNQSPVNSHKGLKIVIIIVLIVAVIVGGSIFVIKGLKDKKSKDNNESLITENIPASPVPIVIKNSDGLYGIINTNGDQLADFKYTYISEFLNGSAHLSDYSENKVGVINSEGEMVVDFGKYKYISSEGYLYKATDADFNSFLLNSKGKVVYDLKNAKVDSYIIPKEIVLVILEDSIDVLDYEGNSIIKLQGKDNYQLYENEENYVTFYHNNVSYIIDMYERKIVHKENSAAPYCVSSVNSEDNSKYVLTECEKPTQYTAMDNDKKLFTSTDCSNLFFENGNLICAMPDYKRYLVDDKGNKGVEIYNTDVIYIDINSYVIKNGSKSDFYLNGKLTKTVDCTYPVRVASRSEGLYTLKNTCTDTVSYYDKKGNKKLEKDYQVAYEFDKNGYAIVSDDKTNKYLIDISGKKISKEYDDIDYNKNSKPINIYVTKKGTSKVILNKKGEEILVTEGNVSYYDTYFTVSKNNQTIYYNFKGKEIYKLG